MQHGWPVTLLTCRLLRILYIICVTRLDALLRGALPLKDSLLIPTIEANK